MSLVSLLYMIYRSVYNAQHGRLAFAAVDTLYEANSSYADELEAIIAKRNVKLPELTAAPTVVCIPLPSMPHPYERYHIYHRFRQKSHAHDRRCLDCHGVADACQVVHMVPCRVMRRAVRLPRPGWRRKAACQLLRVRTAPCFFACNP